MLQTNLRHHIEIGTIDLKEINQIKHEKHTHIYIEAATG